MNLENLKSLTLLCVEDDKTTQQLYSSILEKLFREIIFADDGLDAYDKFLNNSIDILITASETPGLNGLGLIEKIRENNQTIPIILVSLNETLELLKSSLDLNVYHFIQKPFTEQDIFKQLKNIQEKKSVEIKKLQDKESYNTYQEDLAFAKELNILRNDFYYQLIDDKHISLVDFLYQPLDVISGDAYSARRIDDNRTFYLLVDGMGKGLSASLSAMTMTTFVNHLIDKMIEHESFSFHILLKEAVEYIKPILLEEESLSIDFILFDSAYNSLTYSKFAMPAILMQDAESNILRVASNNPPLSKWLKDYKIDEMSISNIEKFLFYSDGIVENSTKLCDRTYADYIENDFKSSFTREDLKRCFFEKVDNIEDDITLIFINRLPLNNRTTKSFETSLDAIDEASEWYAHLWSELTNNTKILNEATLVFTELYMNAYEHGNLRINSATKHQLLEDDIYFETLSEKESLCDKKITVKVNQMEYESSSYIVTQIIDEGEGFDTNLLSEIFRNSAKFNGRGVFISRKNSLGIYYNSKGNSVLYINKV